MAWFACDEPEQYGSAGAYDVKMGLSFRKSFRAGPVRFNLSKSGIGVSTGVRGMRIGTGPRGAYIAGGAKGVYFRQGLGMASARSSSGSTTTIRAQPPPDADRATCATTASGN